VLFHLMDVSRPKGYAAPPPPAFRLGSLDGEAESPETSAASDLHRGALAAPLPSELASKSPTGAAESFDLETAAELVQTKAYGSLPGDLSLPGGPALPDAPTSTLAASAHPEAEPAETVGSLETPPPVGDDAVSPRQRAEERQRKRNEVKKDDWFSTQGKFIVIGFLVALVVTIYVARSGKKPTAAPPVAAKPHAHPGDAATATTPVKQATAIESARITSVRPTTKTTSSSEPKTALHPPTIPQLAEKPAGTSTPADATLFTFSKRSEERVATRTGEPASTGAGSVTPAPATAAANPAPAPTLQPQYPATNYPSTYQPVAPPAAPSSGIYAPSAVPGPALSPAASTGPLYPTTNTASGYRYERTGSSVY
jgi:hypothetical protein